MKLTPHIHVVPTLRKSGAIHPTPIFLHDVHRENFAFILYLTAIQKAFNQLLLSICVSTTVTAIITMTINSRCRALLEKLMAKFLVFCGT
jgi:hypothetical protein